MPHLVLYACLFWGLYSCVQPSFYTEGMEDYFSPSQRFLLEKSIDWFEVELMESYPAKDLESSYVAYLKDVEDLKVSRNLYLRLKGLDFLKEMESMGLRQDIWACKNSHCYLIPSGKLIHYIQHNPNEGRLAWTVQSAITNMIHPNLVANAIRLELIQGYVLSPKDRLYLALYFHFTKALVLQKSLT